MSGGAAPRYQPPARPANVSHARTPGGIRSGHVTGTGGEVGHSEKCMGCAAPPPNARPLRRPWKRAQCGPPPTRWACCCRPAEPIVSLSAPGLRVPARRRRGIRLLPLTRFLRRVAGLGHGAIGGVPAGGWHGCTMVTLSTAIGRSPRKEVAADAPWNQAATDHHRGPAVWPVMPIEPARPVTALGGETRQ